MQPSMENPTAANGGVPKNDLAGRLIASEFRPRPPRARNGIASFPFRSAMEPTLRPMAIVSVWSWHGNGRTPSTA
jgi:hypothetical protein